MSTTPAPEMKPFRQIPTWESNEKFEMTGVELEAIYNFFNIFAPAFNSVQQIFGRHIKDGKIKLAYEYEDGTPISDSEIKEYTDKMNEYFRNKTEAEKEPVIEFSKSDAEPVS